MIEVLFVALMQAAAGPPAEVPQEPATTEQTSEESVTVDPGLARVAERNRRRCRVDNITGSRLGARVCNSDAEREGLTREARQQLENAMRMWDDQSR